MAKTSSCRKLRKSNGYVLRKMCDRQTERQTDGQMNKTDLIGPFSQGWRVDHTLFGLILSHMEKSIQEKGIQST